MNMNNVERRRHVLKLLCADMRAWARSKRCDLLRGDYRSEPLIKFGQGLGGLHIAYLSDSITRADYQRQVRRQDRIINAKITRPPAVRMARAA